MIKTILLVVKIILVLVILVAGVIGFLFFQTWQKNERPEVTSVHWDKETVMIGNTASLEVDLKVPWHRAISSIKPNRNPAGFLPQPEGAMLTKGPLSFRGGYRQWSATIPMVAFEPKDPQGQAVVLPLKRTRRLSAPKTVSIAVPALEVTSPEKPDGIVDANEVLKPKPKQIVEEKPAVEEAKRPVPWPFLIALGLLLLTIGIVLLVVRRAKLGVPPWKTALAELQTLEEQQQQLEPVPFFSRLTDILKLYTADRFDTHSDAETATELLHSLKQVSPLPDGLDTMVRQADLIKFAGAEGNRDTYNDSLNAVRRFVEQTVPDDETSLTTNH